jgi:hypothetical protein
LDWGLGHASRCIPLIRKFSENNKVIAGVTLLTAPLFTAYAPEVQQVHVPAYNIKYSAVLPVWLKVMSQFPKVLTIMRAERKTLEKIIKEHGVTLVISDNRPGLYSKKVRCVYITHQLRIKIPVISYFATALHHRFMNRFSEVWVPDFRDRQMALAGEMSDSRSVKVPVKYLEPMSALFSQTEPVSIRFDYLVLLSGAEPQRSILEAILVDALRDTLGRSLLIRGTTEGAAPQPGPNLEVRDFASGQLLTDLIRESRTIICRSGYSTLMDMFVLKKDQLILIPTPGQTEQIYLAELWKRRFSARVLRQEQVNSHTIRIHSLPARLYTS